MSAAPIIVSALFGAEDQQRLDALRRAHFPPERNNLPAHLTLFHHLPPSIADELVRRLARLARDHPPPPARLTAVMKLGRGVALRVESEKLGAMRAMLAEAFGDCLTPQDAAPWAPHVTIQNKVTPEVAAALHAEFSQDFRPSPIVIAGLAAWHYRGGPWEPLSRHPFSRSGRSRRS